MKTTGHREVTLSLARSPVKLLNRLARFPILDCGMRISD
jgi:hypothetical protein